MAKKPTSFKFECRSCGRREPAYESQCKGCNAWDTYDRITATVSSGDGHAGIVRCTAVKASATKRLRSGLSWFDKALNGGVAQGQRVLLAGKEGGGKTRLCLQVARAVVGKRGSVLFVSGEMALPELQKVATEMSCSHRNVLLTASTQLDDLEALLRRLKPRPVLVFVDSLNVIHDSSLRGAAGSPTQLKSCLRRLGKLCQQHRIPSVFLAQLNGKDVVAGPRFLRHEVDVVASLTVEKDNGRKLTVSKNRLGPETETALRMTSKGLVA